MEVKKPGLCVPDGKKSCNRNRRSNSVKLSPSYSYTPLKPIGGQKGGVLGAGGYTKNSNRKFYQKAESSVSLFTG